MKLNPKSVLLGLAAAPFAATPLGVAGVAALVARSTHATERANPPAGAFVIVDGVRLHYLERGTGSPVVLLHGNGVSALDWETSGVLDALATRHRVIAFDRPGFGYSDRPRGKPWGPDRQAALLHAAFAQLGISRPAVVGQSWGTLVAVALALDFPADVERLVLVSGYYFPSLRLDVPLASMPAIPVLGDILRYTVAPITGKLAGRAMVHGLFAPAPVPERFSRFPLDMSLRPVSLRASAEEASLMVPSVDEQRGRYGRLALPVTVIAGLGDTIVDPHAQSDAFAKLVTGRGALLVEGAGHMVHYARPEQVAAAAD